MIKVIKNTTNTLKMALILGLFCTISAQAGQLSNQSQLAPKWSFFNCFTHGIDQQKIFNGLAGVKKQVAENLIKPVHAFATERPYTTGLIGLGALSFSALFANRNKIKSFFAIPTRYTSPLVIEEDIDMPDSSEIGEALFVLSRSKPIFNINSKNLEKMILSCSKFASAASVKKVADQKKEEVLSAPKQSEATPIISDVVSVTPPQPEELDKLAEEQSAQEAEKNGFPKVPEAESLVKEMQKRVLPASTQCEAKSTLVVEPVKDEKVEPLEPTILLPQPGTPPQPDEVKELVNQLKAEGSSGQSFLDAQQANPSTTGTREEEVLSVQENPNITDYSLALTEKPKRLIDTKAYSFEVTGN